MRHDISCASLCDVKLAVPAVIQDKNQLILRDGEYNLESWFTMVDPIVFILSTLKIID